MKKFLGSLLNIRPRFFHASQVAESPVRANELYRRFGTDDEFDDPRYQKYRVATVRLTAPGKSGNAQGPSCAIFEGVPISTYSGHDGIGLLGFTEIWGKKIFMKNAGTCLPINMPHQPMIPIPAALVLYEMRMKKGAPVDGFSNNEMRFRGDDFVPCTVKDKKIPTANKISGELNRLKFETHDPCFYDKADGSVYYIEDKRKTDKIPMPRDVLSLTNMQHDPEMKKFAEDVYRQTVADIADAICAKDGGTMSDYFFEGSRGADDVLFPLYSDVQKLLKEREKTAVKKDDAPRYGEIDSMDYAEFGSALKKFSVTSLNSDSSNQKNRI